VSYINWLSLAVPIGECRLSNIIYVAVILDTSRVVECAISRSIWQVHLRGAGPPSWKAPGRRGRRWPRRERVVALHAQDSHYTADGRGRPLGDELSPLPSPLRASSSASLEIGMMEHAHRSMTNQASSMRNSRSASIPSDLGRLSATTGR
jgi:hypothetical protein